MARFIETTRRASQGLRHATHCGQNRRITKKLLRSPDTIQMKFLTRSRVIGAAVVLAVPGLLWGGYVLQKKIGAPDDKPR